MITEIKGWHVATFFCAAFSVIIAVNLTLAFSAIRTFPGLEVKNSYIASQQFEHKRRAQTALDWEVSARLDRGLLLLSIRKDGQPIAPQIISARFGRATHIHDDQDLALVFDGQQFVAPVLAADGNWNLRLKALDPSGTPFEQRIIVAGPK